MTSGHHPNELHGVPHGYCTFRKPQLHSGGHHQISYQFHAPIMFVSGRLSASCAGLERFYLTFISFSGGFMQIFIHLFMIYASVQTGTGIYIFADWCTITSSEVHPTFSVRYSVHAALSLAKASRIERRNEQDVAEWRFEDEVMESSCLHHTIYTSFV